MGGRGANRERNAARVSKAKRNRIENLVFIVYATERLDNAEVLRSIERSEPGVVRSSMLGS